VAERDEYGTGGDRGYASHRAESPEIVLLEASGDRRGIEGEDRWEGEEERGIFGGSGSGEEYV